MKRILKIVGLVVGLAVLLPVVFVGTSIGLVFLGRRSITDGQEVNGIRIVKEGFVSVAVIPTGPAEVALIDAGYDKSGSAILAELSRRRLGPEDVTAILITHKHPDHTAAIAVFPKAKVMALETEGPLTERGAMKYQALHDGETVTVGQTQFRVFAVPGHTAGSAAYLVKGVLFLGDAVDIARDGKIESPWIFTPLQAQNRASLVRLDERLLKEKLDVQAIAASHSGVLTEGLAPLTAFAQAKK